MLSTHVPMVGFSTTATTSATQQGAWTGLGLRTLTRLCHASVSFLHAYNFLADDTYLPYPTNSFILAVFCDEDKIPPFVNGTEPGTIDWEEKKAGNPKRWNAFQSRLTYTCPIGFVIEVPGGRHDEQQDPIPVDQESFEVGFTYCYQASQNIRWNVGKMLCGSQSHSTGAMSCQLAYVR